MSASPAQAPSGPNSVTPTTGGPPAPIMRKKKPPVNIFNTGKKKPPGKKPAPGQRPGVPPAQAPNGARPNPLQQQQPIHPPHPSVNGNANPAPPPADENDYTDYPIVISKRALNAAGQRFHALKFHNRKDDKGNVVPVNPFDEAQFVKPLRLHRRYARDKMEAAEASDAAGVDDKEREVMNARRAERQAEREENQKLIAPTGGEGTNRPLKRKQQKKVEEGRDDSNPVRQKRQKLRYEEARPWHLEDFEGKNVWVGSYEEALSERSIMLQPDVNVFRMTPVEKWYRFIETNKVVPMEAEEREALYAKKFTMGRWGLKTQEANDEQRKQEYMARVQAARQAKREEEGRGLGGDEGDFQADRDMLDMEFKDEFQDDDEGVLFQGDEGEDEKEIEQKIWLEMRNAGLGGTGVKDEDLDPEEEERRKAEEERKEKDKTKQLRKQLMKKEHQIQYGSDDEEFDSDDSDEEEQRKKEEQEKEEAAKKAAQVNGDKSGSSTRGTNTPSGRLEKRPGSTLGKRPGSPDASDMSGNESSRKKIKSVNGTATAAGRALSREFTIHIVLNYVLTVLSGHGEEEDSIRRRQW